MNDEILDDLKQFVANTVFQTEERLSKELGGRLDAVEGRLGRVEHNLSELGQEMRDGFAGVGEAIDELAQSQAAQLDVHEQRITGLEQAT